MKCSNARNSSPSTMSIRATVAAVTIIWRSTRRLVAASSEAVISTNGTSASLGPMPISSTRKVSITPAAVIDVWSVIIETPHHCLTPRWRPAAPGLPIRWSPPV